MAHFMGVNYLGKADGNEGERPLLWLAIGCIIQVVNLCLEKKHIIVSIGACNVAANLALQLYTSTFALDTLLSASFFDCWLTILFIFMNGPLKVYLDIKEGKTSVKKLVEEYEDERSQVHERMGVKKRELLPTAAGVNQRRKDKKNDGEDVSEY